MDDNIDNYVPSLLNPRGILKEIKTSEKHFIRRSSLSLKFTPGLTTRKRLDKIKTLAQKQNKDVTKFIEPKDIPGYSTIDDLNTIENNSHLSSEDLNNYNFDISPNVNLSANSDATIIYTIDKPVISLSFKFENSKNVNVGTINTNIKNFSVSHENDDTNITCELVEDSTGDPEVENMYGGASELSLIKKQTTAVNLEIKRESYQSNDNITEEQNVLILNTNAIDKLSHVIVQPPNYKFFKRDVSFSNKSKTVAKTISTLGLKNGKVSVSRDGLKQTSINDYLCGKLRVHTKKSGKKFIETVPLINSRYAKNLVLDDAKDMSKNSGVNDTVVKCDKIRATSFKVSRENDMLSKARLSSPKRDITSLKQQELKASSSEVPRSISPKLRNGSIGSFSPRKNLDSIHFSLPSKTRSNKTNTTSRNIPFYKIVAGTHFAVDAFSYGDIPNVNIYFLTHFHSDHYSGLKRTFNKTLYCSKITADLCVSRLGVNPKHLQVLIVDDTIKIEGIEVTAVDANHCPGAIMLVFTLPNGKTLLHTGDFRASPVMESYPVFWNKDMHTIYLDTTYCNPRYDFPTQDQSLEMALNLLRDKKTKLEEAGKKFSSVLIVCGAYTIGKEKFFLGIARRVGCLVWACPEKDRVLQVVEGQSFGRSAPHTCQLHVVPMRELTHEKLRAHLDSLQGAFSEVVAFKPSGWESGKTTAVTRDCVTIHGIPYSEHSSFSELIRFVKFLKPKQVVPTVDISGGVKTVQSLSAVFGSDRINMFSGTQAKPRQQFFPCPLVYKEDLKCQSRLTDYYSVQSRQRVQAV